MRTLLNGNCIISLSPAYTSRRDNLSPMICLRRFVEEGGLYTSRRDHDATGDCDRLVHVLLLVAAGTAVTAQRNHVELFENGEFVCSPMESSSFELRVCHHQWRALALSCAYAIINGEL